MFHSYSNQDRTLELFSSVLRRISAGEHGYEKIVRLILENTQQLATGEKNFYTIDRDNFDIIVFLYDNDKDFFQNINLSKIDKKDYLHISSILNKDNLTLAE